MTVFAMYLYIDMSHESIKTFLQYFRGLLKFRHITTIFSLRYLSFAQF